MNVRGLTVAMVAAVAVALAAPALRAQTVDEIVARNIAAKGGIDKIKAVQTMKQTSHIKIQGVTATLTLYFKRPNLSRQEVNVGGATIVAAFDGTTAWGMNPMAGQTTPQVLNGPAADQARNQADFDPPLLDYQAKGTKVEFVGNETSGPQSLVHLRITDKRGVVTQCYLDAKTGLEAKIVADGPTGPAETVLGDYRTVDGLTMPFSIKTSAGGMVVADVTVDKIEFDAPMAPTLFSMPVK
jgi:outer membrane lipoprotein-sorting protein